jgi:urease accessory protein
VTIVEQVHRVDALGSDTADFARGRMTLTWEERRQGHGRRRSDEGLEFGISLPPGTVLKHGDCLVLAPERAVVVVEEAIEPVFVIRTQTARDWAFYAYHVGNRHQPLALTDRDLVVPQNPAVRSLLDQLHASYVEDRRPFNALIASGHSHG